MRVEALLRREPGIEIAGTAADGVAAVEAIRAGESEVRLANGVRLRVSRSRREALERWLGRTS